MSKGIPTNGINKGWFKKGQKMSFQMIKKSSDARRGKLSGMLGKKHTKKTKLKMSEVKKGKTPKNLETLWKIPWTSERRKKGGIAKMGNKNPIWKGGISGRNLLEKREKIAGRKKPKQCEICGAIGRICFDHDHNTGEFRGWICRRCNLVLGSIKDNSELLLAMINYLRNYGNNQRFDKQS
jgi:hypothetical protein